MTSVLSDPTTHALMADRGLAYGDGLFETMRAEAGRLPLLRRHLDRLLSGCERLGLPAPDRDALEARVLRLARTVQTGIVKIIVTRGPGARGYRPPTAPQLRVMTEAHPLPEYPRRNYTEGVSLQVCETRIGRSSLTVGLKHLGRLEQVVASAELRGDCVEGLMLDEHDYVIEGTRTNLFLAMDDALVTPRLDMSGVAGVMRSLVLDAAGRLGIDCREDRVRLADVARAEEIFVTNAVIGIWPAKRIDAIGWNGAVGPLAKRLMTAVAAGGVPSWAP